MKYPTIIIALAAVLALGGAASAQMMLPPGMSRFSPLPPAPLPPPKIEAPVVPQLDAPATQNYRSTPRASFGDRITTCLEEGAANGIRPNARAAFSRSCANSN